jgi:hypothetical protein
MAMKPRRLFPQPSPSFAYMDGPARGKRAPTKDRVVVTAARAEAAYSGKLSIIYVWIGLKIPIIPKPNGTSPIIGTIQKTWYFAVQPYQKKVIGTNIAKKTHEGSRISGSKTPLLAFVIRITVASNSLATRAKPIKNPRPTLTYARPQISGFQPYESWNTPVIVVKRRYLCNC